MTLADIDFACVRVRISAGDDVCGESDEIPVLPSFLFLCFETLDGPLFSSLQKTFYFENGRERPKDRPAESAHCPVPWLPPSGSLLNKALPGPLLEACTASAPGPS